MSAAPFAVRLAEALLFASSEPVREQALLQLLRTHDAVPQGDEEGIGTVRATLDALQTLYAGRGVQPVEVGGGWQFRTAPDLAPHLTRVLQRPRRLARAAMETLSVIAYHQPCTRTEVEQIRGVSLGQSTLDALLEAALIVPRGRKQVPGRPVLWGTSPSFLSHFGLRDLRELPRRDELLLDPGGADAPELPGSDPGRHPGLDPGRDPEAGPRQEAAVSASPEPC